MTSHKMNQDLKLNTDILFSKPQEERVDFEEKDLIELFPYGLSLSNDSTRPFMILKDKNHEVTLPVPINHLEAGVTLTQSANASVPVTLHKFSESLLKSLDIKLERCIFVEIKGVHQYVRLYMLGHTQYHSMKFRADEVMSLCIHMKVSIFATKSIINKSKVMSAELVDLAQSAESNPLLMVKHHQYLM